MELQTAASDGVKGEEDEIDVDSEAGAGEEDEDSEEEEADFPEVKLDELLEDFDEMTIQDREE